MLHVCCLILAVHCVCTEFVYPETWVGDQRLLYRAVEKAERQRLYGINKNDVGRRNGLIEPIVAFGPPGSSGELNVSVVVAPIPYDFRYII